MNLPLVFELCAALAAGVCGSLLLISWKEVPTAYFRTHCHILLALWVIAALDAARAGGSIAPLQWALAGAILAFLSGFAWGLGLPRLGVPLIAAGLLVGVWVLASPSLLRAGSGFNLWLFAPSSKLASGFLLGSTLSAMLLGHHYLTAPAMSLVPLKRLNLSSAFGLIFRACIAALGLWIWTKSTSIQELLSSGIGVYVLAALAGGPGLSPDRSIPGSSNDPNRRDAVGHGDPLHSDDTCPLRRGHCVDSTTSGGHHPLVGWTRPPGVSEIDLLRVRRSCSWS